MEAKNAIELLREVRPLLNLSGLAKAAQAGFLSRFGIRNVEELDRLKSEIDTQLEEADESG